MTKQELVTEIAARAGLNKTQAELALNAFTNTVAETMRDGGEVVLVGFGTFSAANRAARIGTNLHTGEKLQIPATKVPRFSAGKKLKAAVSE